MARGRIRGRWLAAVAAAAVLSGCAVLPGFGGRGPVEVTVEAVADANRDTVTVVDLVFVYDATVARAVPDTAPAWFTRRAELRRSHPQALEIVSLEVAPGERIRAPELPRREQPPVQVLAFAWMVTPAGQGVLDLTEIRRPTIVIGESSLTVGGGR